MGMSGALAELATSSVQPAVYLRHDLLGKCDLQVPVDKDKCRTLHDLRREASLRFCRVLGLKKGMEEGNPPVIAAFTTKTGEILSDFMPCTNLKDGQVVVAHLTQQAEKMLASSPRSKGKQRAPQSPRGMMDYVECYFRDLDPSVCLWLPIVGIATLEELRELAERLLAVRFPNVHIVRFRDENGNDIPSYQTLEEAKITAGSCVEAVDASEDEYMIEARRGTASPRRHSISTGAKKFASTLMALLPGSPTLHGANGPDAGDHGEHQGVSMMRHSTDLIQAQKVPTPRDGMSSLKPSLDMNRKSLELAHKAQRPDDKGSSLGSDDRGGGCPEGAASSKGSDADHHDPESQLASPMGAVTPGKGGNRISRLLQRFHQPEGGHFQSMSSPTSAPTTPH